MTIIPRTTGRGRAGVVLLTLVALMTFALPATAAPPSGGPPPDGPAAERCAALVGSTIRVDRDTAVIDTASVVPAVAGTPEHCDLGGRIGNIGFRMQFPTESWNQRYFQTGCGGFCGYIPIDSCGDALSRGYAVAAEDSGHQDQRDGSWAHDNRQAEIDWGYRSPHVVAVAAKQYIERFYGQAPTYSYFQGCSTGGRQALSEAQRYPDDFDGIVAGAPALYQNYLAPLSQGYLETVNRRADGTVILPTTKVPVVAAAALERCDGRDGAVDGVIADPEGCDFDPGTLQCDGDVDQPDCLTSAQIDVVRAFYAPPVDDRGRQLYPGGLVVGSEAGWPGWSIGTDTALSGGGNYAQQVLQYLAFPKDPGPGYSLSDFDPTRDAPKLRSMAQIYNADEVKLRHFERAGGKLLVWHGWADPLITPEGTINYVRDAVAANGGRAATEDWMRLFLLPGVYHCAGGPGEDTVDWLSAIERWVEHGEAPDQVTASKLADGDVVSTRVVSEYVID
ncbi:tannase/feruloyl esterase family alpha/beta hydrolase [Blastococcus sp. SYSU DS0973]